jgi:GLPGLI family protein
MAKKFIQDKVATHIGLMALELQTVIIAMNPTMERQTVGHNKLSTITFPYKFMRKSLILLSLYCLFFVQKINAQIILTPFPRDVSKMTIIDSSKIRIIYAFNSYISDDINDSENYEDLQYLEIGESISKYYSFCIYCVDSVNTNWGNKKIEKTDYVMTESCDCGKHTDEQWSEYYYSDFFMDFTKNTLIEYVRMPMYMYQSNCFYIENIPEQTWQLHDDTTTIKEHLCQKATCEFRGRHYIAWFTSDIPINQGPWKFNGLPGLIMRIYDSDYLFMFECIGIEIYDKDYPVKIYNYKDYKKTERKNLLKFQKKIHEDYFNAAGLQFTKRPGVELLKKQYHPMELE